MKTFIKKVFTLILSIVTVLTLTSCNSGGSLVIKNENGLSNVDTSQVENNVWGEKTPNISITEIGGNSSDEKSDDIQNEIEEGNVNDIYSLILSAVSQDLEEAGFICKTGVAETIENDNYSALGLYYYDEQIELFNNDDLMSVGFVEIVDKKEKYKAPSHDNSVIVVNDIEDISVDENLKVCVYNFNNIGSYHFVFKNKYVSYYQETSMRIVYEIKENLKSNYDLSLGNLYDYDNKQYIYDESIFGEYKSHSAVELFSEEDYEKLEEELIQLSEIQLNNGYRVDEYKIVYISPESIQSYLSSNEEDTFFGYSVDELTEELGIGTALQYTENGFVESPVLNNDDSYNWKSFLAKVGIGCGIILVGAVLTPITGGASFGCALLTISKFAVTCALSSAIGGLAVELCVGMVQGKDFKSALKDATYSGLDQFANGFMIGAVIGSVGVVSGIIKPSACFVAGTEIATMNGLKTIENIKIGDYVLSYNEESKLVTPKKVYDLFVKEVFKTIEITINGEVIETTFNHPFYSYENNGWVEACNLKIGDKVLNSHNEVQLIENIMIKYNENPVKVYNFSVEDNHNYYVGEQEILVHNTCTTLNGQRNKAVKDAWKNEVNAVKDGTSKYNWSPDEIEELLTRGSIKGYEGHHIIPVNEVVNTSKASLISDPNNIVFLTKSEHVYVHTAGDSFEGTYKLVLECQKWVAEHMMSMGWI